MNYYFSACNFKKLILDRYRDFIEQAKTIKNVTSAQGRRYQVDGLTGDTLLFCRMDAAARTGTSTCERPIEAYLAENNFMCDIIARKIIISF